MMLHFRVQRNWGGQRMLMREYRSAWGWGWEVVRNLGWDHEVFLPWPLDLGAKP